MSNVPSKRYFLRTTDGRLLVSEESGKPFTVTMMGGGIAWDVTSAYELPADAEYLDICLVPTKSTYPLIDTSDLTVVRFAHDLVVNDGNIYPENAIMFFSKEDGVEGESEITVELDQQTLCVWDFPLAASVVNVDGLQQKCNVYIYNGTEWVLAPYVQLPLIYNESLDLTQWLGTTEAVGAIPDLWQLLGLTEEFENAPAYSNDTTETLDLDTWLGSAAALGTIPDLWSMLGLTESGQYSINSGTPIPID